MPLFPAHLLVRARSMRGGFADLARPGARGYSGEPVSVKSKQTKRKIDAGNRPASGAPLRSVAIFGLFWALLIQLICEHAEGEDVRRQTVRQPLVNLGRHVELRADPFRRLGRRRRARGPRLRRNATHAAPITAASEMRRTGGGRAKTGARNMRQSYGAGTCVPKKGNRGTAWKREEVGGSSAALSPACPKGTVANCR